MADAIWTIARAREGRIDRGSLEAACLGRKLADSAHAGLECLVLGSRTPGLDTALVRLGADRVLLGELPPPLHSNMEAHVHALAEMIPAHKPRAVLFSGSAWSLELAGRLAGKLLTGLASDCVELKIHSDGLLATQAPRDGRETTRVKISGHPPMACLKPNSTSLSRKKGQGRTESFEPRTGQPRTRVLNSNSTGRASREIDRAPVVICGGLGVGGPDFSLLEDLARSLDGAVGATRPAVDARWRSPKSLIGPSGKAVAPRLLVACGVSGSFPLFLKTNPQCLVAINSNPDAPIFSRADYGIAGDLFEVVSALARAVKERKKE